MFTLCTRTLKNVYTWVRRYVRLIKSQPTIFVFLSLNQWRYTWEDGSYLKINLYNEKIKILVDK